MKNKCFIIKVNHSDCGIFTATFYQKGKKNMIEYISETGSKVEFKFDT